MLGWFKALSLGARLGLIIGIIAFIGTVLGGSYYIGYKKGENLSKIEISKYEIRLQTLNTKLAQAQGKVDVRVVTEYKDRVAYVDRVVYKTRTVVETSVPEQFKLSKGWVNAYNSSVASTELDISAASDPAPSKISDKQALLVITDNNGICLANQAQLDSLQQWIRETNKAQKSITKN